MLDILYTECYFISNCKRLHSGVLCSFLSWSPIAVSKTVMGAVFVAKM